jgi:hypothetical protein
MLVRVEMRWISAHEQPKALELTLQVLRRPSLHDGGGPRRSPLRKPGRLPAPNLNMQPKPEARSLPCPVSSLARRRALHHQARARDDAVGVGSEDPLVDALAEAEIVGIDDQVAHAHSNGAASEVGALLTMNDAP